MRILFIIDSLGTGGAERSTLDYCYYLKKLNYHIQIICLQHRDIGIQQEAIEWGFKIHFLDSKRLLSHLRQINKIYAGYRPQIVHTTLFKSRLRGKLHKIFYFKKHLLVESLVTLPFTREKLQQRKHNFIRTWFHKVFESLLCSVSVNHHIAISEEVKDHFIKNHFLVNNKQLSVIYRGRAENVFLDERENLRKQYAGELGYKPEALIFIHVGRQDVPKNHTFLLTAFFKLLEVSRYDKQIVLLCVGRRGDMSEKIDLLMNQPSKSSNIFFLGHRADVTKLLAQSDIFIFPSLFEGLGGSIIEAKAACLPFIVSNIKVFKELLVEDREAYFANLPDIDDFVAKMEFLAMHPGTRRHMGHENLKSFRERFSIDQINNQMHQLYAKLLNENSSTGYQETIQGR